MAATSGRSAPPVGASADSATKEDEAQQISDKPSLREWPTLSNLPILDLLYEQGYRFRFHQAVRLLQRLLPERRPVGFFEDPSEEVVHFRAHASLAFPQSEIVPPAYDSRAGKYVIIPPKDSIEPSLRHPAELTVAFMGLTGPLGVLPRHYTARIIDRVRSHGERRPDPTLRDFLDLFHHRLVSLLHRAWSKPRLAVQVERRMQKPSDPGNPQTDDPTRYLYSLLGLGTPGLLGRQELADDGLLRYAGVLGHMPRSVGTLTEILVEQLDVPVHVEQFVGAAYPIPEELLSQLGEVSCGLGENAIVGDEAFVPDAKFRVRLGPLSSERYTSLLPAGQSGSEGREFRQLVQLIRMIAGPDLDFDIQLLLAPGDLSGCVLGAEGSLAPQLGHTAWLLDEERVTGLSDTIFAGTLTGLVHEKRV